MPSAGKISQGSPPHLRAAAVVALVLAILPAVSARADEPHRDSGVPTSQPGIYLDAGEWVVEPYLEVVRNHDFEYDPGDFGFAHSADQIFGRYRSDEMHLFAAYGLGDRVGLELQTQVRRTKLERAPDDLSGMPDERKESGLGRTSLRIDWRWIEQRGRRPELFSYAEAVLPHDRDQPLTGTPDWLVNGGLGAIRDFRWGTLTVRAGFEYDTSSESAIDFHEYAIEVERRLHQDLSLVLGYVVFEGDEGYLATNLLWSCSRRLDLQAGVRRGVVSGLASTTGNSADWIVSLGLVFRSVSR